MFEESTSQNGLQVTETNPEQQKSTLYRFDLFFGVEGKDGKVEKKRSLGTALLADGTATYIVYVKSLLKDTFYVLQDKKKQNGTDYVILTREPSLNPARKYHWNAVGEGRILSGANSGLMKMKWDFFGAENVYMSLHPFNRDLQAS